MSKELDKLRDFASIWNAAKSYPTAYDLERCLGKKYRAIKQTAERYTKARITHPSLPELIWRRGGTGQPIPIPFRALSQLDPFRIDLDEIKKAKGIVITSAQFGANIHKGFWDSLKTYAGYREFPLVVMPIKYGPIHYSRGRLTSTFPSDLMGHLIFEDVMLCKGQLQLNVTRMRPTLERFLTDTICEMGGPVSQIFAAPTLELEHRARIGHDYPKAIMTTGSVSIPNYSLDRLGQQDRTGEIAIENHTFAALVVEFDGKKFHFRQLMANKRGEFYDIDPIQGGARFFTPKGYVHKPHSVEGLVCGDWHTGKTCLKVRRTTFGKGSITDRLKPKNVVLHDFVDGDSVSHYEQHQASRRAWKAPKLYDSMEIELRNSVKELKWMGRQVPHSKLHVVASNHPEFLTEYIENMRWAKDDANLVFGARVFSAMVGDLETRNPAKVNAKALDPVVMYLRKFCPEVNVLERTDKLLLGASKILCSMHGDIGTRGAPSRSNKEFRKMNQWIILGHNHTGTILGPVWRVGTSTPRMQFYVTTPSTQWTNTHCVIFDNGQRMLINIVDSHWYKTHQTLSPINDNYRERRAA